MGISSMGFMLMLETIDRVKLITFLDQAEQVLLPVAARYTPEGSEPKAVVHQWLNAITDDKPLFGEHAGADKSEILSVLQQSQLFPKDNGFLSELYKSQPFKPVSNPTFSFIDLFAGIGGFRLALQAAGGESVFSSEWDKAAQETYFKNYGEYPFGDITVLTNEAVTDLSLDRMVPDHDVLAAGFPCQPFSHAGVSARTSRGTEHGFKCKTQGTLFFDVMRIVSVKMPKVLFLENVRNIERHDKGYTFQVIKESIEELGYDFKYKVIDSSSVVPQKRVRCYMVCFRKDLEADFKFPSFDGDVLPLSSILQTEGIDRYTISDKLWAGHINRTRRNLERGTGFTALEANLDKPSHTLVARYGKDGKECLVPQTGKNPRFLSPRECARLQGFPEEFIIPEAKTPAYKQFGNSVAVPVVSRIAAEIIKEIG